ncbi:Sodium/proton antiporter, cpa1 family protein [Candidatus Accumulibacter aalborgensis]|uniref:Sodium/proton antiporter, cpa1 family protein n=1 Tax=Candidatus Accumulibacter aalborgensis TaxID=1860102 RepID=A0A1A8XRY1_9PROT|nr:cation:proton antiporter [Candidatus Accumulibacter aalborgensis]SBT07446.1 Sodium/proton antiporter, cpa1 family protein [Candidatus Accumulibacter aalborgensis]
MTYQAIFVASVFLLLAFGMERMSRIVGVPSVVVLIATGLIGKPVLAALDVSLAGIDEAVPVLGTVGLVLIVLEGALDIELRRERLRAAAGAFVMATAGFVVCTAAFASLVAFVLPLSIFQATILAVPFAVISSAVAIPSSGFLPQHGREFVLYESSVSDILGVMFFFALLHSDGSAIGILTALAGGGIISLVLAVLCAIGLTLIMLRIDGHIRFIPLLAGMFGLYAAGKLLHLSPLIMIVLLGLALNNPTLITRLRPFRHLLDDRYEATLDEFKLLTKELTFAVRGFFFILLGCWTDLSTLISIEAWVAAGVVLLVIYVSRYVILRLACLELIDRLIWLAPRGLITVLLFLPAKEAMSLPAYVDGAVMLVVLISSSLTTVGRLRWDRLSTAG